MEKSKNLEKFFNPKSVALIGASSDKKKVGYALASNLLAGAKREIFFISIGEKEILGQKTFASISEINDGVDLAIIAVRADIVPQIISDCAKKGIKSVIIISAGFKEAGEVGKKLEEDVSALAIQNGMSILGPNCLGTIDSHSDLNASFSGEKPLAGGITFLSQSGALGTSVIDLALAHGVGFSKFISLGNEANLTEIEFLEFLAKDDSTKAVLIYLEKLSNGAEFMRLASEITKTKPVVVLKAGRSKRGSQAVMSHTGSLAPEDSVFTAACRQSGIIVAESIREFFNLAKLFQIRITKPLQNLVVLTNGGGPSVVTSDLIDLSKSLTLVEFSEETKDELRKVLPSMAAVGNPVDIIGDALSNRYEDALKVLCSKKDIEKIDGIVLMLTPQMMTEVEATAKLVIEYRKVLPIIPVFLGGPMIQPGADFLRGNGLVNFNFPKDAVEALDDLARGMAKKEIAKAVIKEGTENTTGTSRMLPFAEMDELLKSVGISLVGKLVKNKAGLAEAWSEILVSGVTSESAEISFALKAISPDIIHKTDAGAVALNIRTKEEAVEAWEKIMLNIAKNVPGAVLEGMLLQPKMSGKEIIIGMKRDAVFGPTILFGLGGIFTEALKDTSLRIAPVSKENAMQMIKEIRGSGILFGLRGERPMNTEALADLIVRISELSILHTEIKEIDFNPVTLIGESAFLVDARIMI
ncbi:MAG: acetate--CoA ligase family protein [Candidatus Taylorbacteria bacterium]|nr:acetate--CoA ligase family protein [Candidatus Taylorbacteria bacterium]